jgi:hypothetical protein
MEPDTGPFTMNVVGCARCDGDGHAALTFEPFTHPYGYPAARC